MSVLLTSEATEEAMMPHKCGGAPLESVLSTFLRYHATEGREVLVETVCRALSPDGRSGAMWRDEAEAVVTALFGEPRDA